MHRTNLLSLLNNYYPIDVHENESKEKTITFIQQYPDCFERSLEVGHITASCWLVNQDNTKALLTHHKKLNMWIQLGGHCDGNADVLAVALKEAQEESGITDIQPFFCNIFDIDVHLIPENKKEKAHYHHDIRFLLQAGHENSIISDESHDLLWITKNRSSLPSNNPSVVRMFNKWVTKKFSAAVNF